MTIKGERYKVRIDLEFFGGVRYFFDNTDKWENPQNDYSWRDSSINLSEINFPAKFVLSTHEFISLKNSKRILANITPVPFWWLRNQNYFYFNISGYSSVQATQIIGLFVCKDNFVTFVTK